MTPLSLSVLVRPVRPVRRAACAAFRPLTGALPLLLLLALLSLGCARSPSTSWYLLSGGAPEAPHSATAVATPKGAGPLTVQLRRVDIPGYLDRAGIVTREAGDVQIKVAEFHSWAEPLSTGMQRALSAALLPLLAQGDVLLQALDDDSRGPLQAFVQVQRLDGSMGGQAQLEARWSLRTQQDVTLARGAFVDSEPAGTDYASLVRAQSALVRRLAESMAQPMIAATRNAAKAQAQEVQP